MVMLKLFEVDNSDELRQQAPSFTPSELGCWGDKPDGGRHLFKSDLNTAPQRGDSLPLAGDCQQDSTERR